MSKIMTRIALIATLSLAILVSTSAGCSSALTPPEPVSFTPGEGSTVGTLTAPEGTFEVTTEEPDAAEESYQISGSGSDGFGRFSVGFPIMEQYALSSEPDGGGRLELVIDATGTGSVTLTDPLITTAGEAGAVTFNWDVAETLLDQIFAGGDFGPAQLAGDACADFKHLMELSCQLVGLLGLEDLVSLIHPILVDQGVPLSADQTRMLLTDYLDPIERFCAAWDELEDPCRAM